MNLSDIKRQQCRACLEEVKSFKYFSEPIDSSDPPLDIFSAFTYCTNLEFGQQEASVIIQQYICNSCVNSLKFAYEFIKKARESDCHLRGVVVEDIVEYIGNETPKYNPSSSPSVSHRKEDESGFEAQKYEEEEVTYYEEDPAEISETEDPDAGYQKDEIIEETQDIEVDSEQYILEEVEQPQDTNYDSDGGVPDYIMTTVEDVHATEVVVDIPENQGKRKKSSVEKSAKKVFKALNHKCSVCCEYF